ncbi:MAG TPA: di-heme oxidoredictase family protein [Pyrinomonadaceae bacterium]
MKLLKLSALVLVLAVLVLPSAFNRIAHSQSPEVTDASEKTITPEDAAKTAATTDQANKVSSDDDTAAKSAVDGEGVAEGTTDTFSYDPDVDPAAAETAGKTPTTDIRCWPPPPPVTKAPADFDNKTNGLIPQGTPVPPGVDDPTPGTFEADKFIFAGVDEIEDGLGPVYNAQSCRECHQNPVTGAISQINELRAGHNLYCNVYGQCSTQPCPGCSVIFVDAPGGSLINDRGIPTPNNITPPFFGAKVQERVPPLYTASIIGGPPLLAEEKVRTFRTSLNTLGDGFVEAIANQTLLNIAAHQASSTGGVVHGQAIKVPVLEVPGCNPNIPSTCPKRIGRFGWKDQHASLLSFSSDAYLNEMGITNRFTLHENTSLGRSVAPFDPFPDNVFVPCDSDPTKDCGEDPEEDIKIFTEFMRATKAPPQDPDIQAAFAYDINIGKKIFSKMPNAPFSCAVCHVPKIQTAPPCTWINGGTFLLPNALGNKIIMPFSDFLLHDIGTGDGIVQNGGQKTRLKVRTPPLWGVRTRDRLMHDGESLTFREAILRHAGEATPAITGFINLSEPDKRRLIMYLESL